ncbi:hypothetical protein TSOC_010843 [Tetrabaena socialis]|uniref:Uncharacterized protein n=1 Tax=Tetrabaena socialis TaxID=47790 RepID=A0A2J7ZSC8_9CHLO|nr:hypothetical protein TSOC_010843 [Tetrabaena socialis]|eukprot:PNH03140.1 hypothetical protein TSOC_010843 [Tetrabaena socialis]
MAFSRALLIAACLALAVAAPERNPKDCVSPNLLSVAGLNVYPSTRQIQSSSVQALQDKTTVQVAQNFQVTYYSTFKVGGADLGVCLRGAGWGDAAWPFVSPGLVAHLTRGRHRPATAIPLRPAPA